MLSRGSKITLNQFNVIWSHIAPMSIMYGILWVSCSFKCLALALVFVNWPDNLIEWRLLSISSIPGWTLNFDDKCYLGGQKWVWTCPGGVIIASMPIMYGILWVSCSFKCLALALVFVNWPDNLIEWRLLSISSIPGWTLNFDDKCYLGGQKWVWTCPGGVIITPMHVYIRYTPRDLFL